jgi:hypothetical protein
VTGLSRVQQLSNENIFIGVTALRRSTSTAKQHTHSSSRMDQLHASECANIPLACLSYLTIMYQVLRLYGVD